MPNGTQTRRDHVTCSFLGSMNITWDRQTWNMSVGIAGAPRNALVRHRLKMLRRREFSLAWSNWSQRANKGTSRECKVYPTKCTRNERTVCDFSVYRAAWCRDVNKGLVILSDFCLSVTSWTLLSRTDIAICSNSTCWPCQGSYDQAGKEKGWYGGKWFDTKVPPRKVALQGKQHFNLCLSQIWCI